MKQFMKAYLSMVLIASLSARAQNYSNASPEERAAKLTEWMKMNLNLTDEQIPKIQEVNLKYANRMEALKNNDHVRSQKVKEAQSTSLAKDDELELILTDEQFNQYESKKEELKEEFREKMKARKKTDD